MKFFRAIVGYLIGVLLTILLLSMFSIATDSKMPNSFIPANIGGIILAVFGYNFSKNKKLRPIVSHTAIHKLNVDSETVGIFDIRFNSLNILKTLKILIHSC